MLLVVHSWNKLENFKLIKLNKTFKNYILIHSLINSDKTRAYILCMYYYPSDGLSFSLQIMFIYANKTVVNALNFDDVDVSKYNT